MDIILIISLVQSRVNGKTVRVTLGAHGALALEQARTEAKKKLGEMAKGVHLNQAERVDGRDIYRKL
jgi:hypothetical protein